MRSKGEAERLTQIDNRAIDGFTDQREVEWAKLSKFEVRRRNQRGEEERGVLNLDSLAK